MVCGFRAVSMYTSGRALYVQFPLAAFFGLALAACSGITPPSTSSSDEQGIVGGTVDSTDHGILGILIKNQALCTGTLIAPNLVLTARHCVSDVSTGDANIDCTQSTFGTPYPPSSFLLSWESDLTGNVPHNSVYQTTSVNVPGPTSVCGNDVALLTLSSSVPGATATPIAPRVDQAPQANETFTAVGYGLTDPNDTQGTTAGVRHELGGLAVGCVGAIQCLGTRAKDDEWAANTPVCHGDSGGPALDSEGRVFGVASRADSACSFGLYSSVASWQSLIVTTAVAAATSGGYEPPTWTTENPDAGASGGTGGTGGSGTGGTGGTATPIADAGVPPPAQAGASNDGGLVKPGPELGDACTDSCFGDLLCYSGNGKPPGVCVEPCSASNASCPADSVCNVSLGACIPKSTPPPSPKSSASSGCGCRLGAENAPNGSEYTLLGALALCGGMLRRRRRA